MNTKKFNGSPCKRCGSTLRWRANRNCTACAMERSWLTTSAMPTRQSPERCECCGGLPSTNKPLNVDHDHKTGEFRGWLCTACNGGLARLGDSLDGVTKAMLYLFRAS